VPSPDRDIPWDGARDAFVVEVIREAGLELLNQIAADLRGQPQSEVHQHVVCRALLDDVEKKAALFAKPFPADNNDVGRVIASIVSGIVVGVLTGVAARSFLEAAMWSPIHGGISDEITLNVLSLVAVAIPPACGFLAGWAIYRWRPRRTAIQMTDSIPVNCPHCGCSMKPSARYSATPPYTVVECPIHGPFYFGPKTDLTLGRPPQI